MASQAPQPHFVLFPLMAQGHMIPMMDFARILAQHNVTVTVVTTPHNAARFTQVIARASASGLQIRFVQIPFPCQEAGLPDGCENIDMLPSLGMAFSLFNAASSLQEPVETLFQELTPRPTCIVSDMILPYTAHIASKYNIPRISFGGINCFTYLCFHNIRVYDVLSMTAESEHIVLPGMPDKIELTKDQIQASKADDENLKKFQENILSAEMVTYGVIVNSFEELEPAYARAFQKTRADKVWCIGPVSLCNKVHLDKAQRGNKASVDENHCLKWLDLQKPGSVIYVCLGSICNLSPLQLMELGLALEASTRPFIWVIRGGSQLEELQKWIKESGFENRTEGRALVIRGWAPQILILSHTAIGGFITHTGWNSTLEAISEGVPILTWPLFGDQFFNEKLVVQILKIGVRVGVESPTKWGEEDKTRILVKKEDIQRAVDELMDESNESEERRKRIRELAQMAKRSVEEGGSSHRNVTLLIQDIMQQTRKD